MITKYNFDIDNNVINTNINRLINQIWKLIPMWENQEDWEKHLSALISEIAGLSQVFGIESSYLILLSKLEGLKQIKEFSIFRKVVFESISLLSELILDE